MANMVAMVNVPPSDIAHDNTPDRSNGHIDFLRARAVTAVERLLREHSAGDPANPVHADTLATTRYETTRALDDLGGLLVEYKDGPEQAAVDKVVLELLASEDGIPTAGLQGLLARWSAAEAT